MRIVIATTKDWNIKNALLFQKNSKDDVYIITKNSDLDLESIKKINPDFIFFPHWSNYIKEEIYINFKCVVFHMTDLPFGRGGSPLQNLISRGIYNTKISAITVCGEFDAGNVYLKRDLNIEKGSAEEIFKRASHIIFNNMIPEITKNNLTPIEQNGEIVIFSRRTPEQSEIQFNMTKEQLYDHIRMLDAEGYPNAFINYGDYRLEFYEVTTENNFVECKVRWKK